MTEENQKDLISSHSIETRITFLFCFNVLYVFYLLENDQWDKVITVAGLLAKRCLVQFSRQKSIICCIDMKQMYLRCDKVSLICFKK